MMLSSLNICKAYDLQTVIVVIAAGKGSVDNGIPEAMGDSIDGNVPRLLSINTFSRLSSSSTRSFTTLNRLIL